MAQVVHNRDVEPAGNRFSRALDAEGIGVRDTVVALLANTPEYYAVYRGCTWSGRRLTPLSWRWNLEEARYVVENSEARALVADVRFAKLARGLAEGIPERSRFSVGGSIPGFRPWSDVESLSGAPYPSPLAGDIMLYTSGTTGRPKGVHRPFPNDEPPPTMLGRMGMQMIQAFTSPSSRGGTHLVACPLYHVAPCTYSDGALLLEADVVLMESFDAEEFLSLVEKHRVTSTFLVPTQFVRLLRLPKEVRDRYDLSSLQLIMHGAAPVSVPVKEEMIAWLGPVLFEFYGGTEGGGVMIDSRDWLAHKGSVGRPRPGLEIHILDDDGTPVPVGTPGHIYFAGEESPFEYKDDPEKTAEARRGTRFTLGDIGRIDDEGYLYLLDRRADIIISGGVNIYPAEIESALLELASVSDCCAVGIPNDEWGEEVRVVVEVDGARAPGDRELADAILDHCRQRLAGYQVPRGVDFVEKLPRTETGKLARRTVREPYWAGRDRRI
ncbi:MAG: AMP-binding protein [Myxococcota bacterium]|nr:AMP-binding protein [Myxococcota bacterium]